MSARTIDPEARIVRFSNQLPACVIIRKIGKMFEGSSHEFVVHHGRIGTYTVYSAYAILHPSGTMLRFWTENVDRYQDGFFYRNTDYSWFQVRLENAPRGKRRLTEAEGTYITGLGEATALMLREYFEQL